jgi:hypothetical protein
VIQHVTVEHPGAGPILIEAHDNAQASCGPMSSIRRRWR